MKKIILFALLILGLSATSAMAASITFDVDDYLVGFSATVDGSTTNVDLSSLSNINDWSASTTYSFDYDATKEYTFVWNIENKASAWRSGDYVSTPSADYHRTPYPFDREQDYDNPMAFVGSADLGAYGTLLSDLNAYWSITSSDGSAYTLAYNDPNSTWMLNDPSGVDDAFLGAYWLGVCGATAMEVTLVIPAQATPIPGAAWLLGTGLLGLVGLRRRIRG